MDLPVLESSRAVDDVFVTVPERDVLERTLKDVVGTSDFSSLLIPYVLRHADQTKDWRGIRSILCHCYAILVWKLKRDGCPRESAALEAASIVEALARVVCPSERVREVALIEHHRYFSQ